MSIVSETAPVNVGAVQSSGDLLEKRIAEAFEIFDHAGNRTVDVREIGTIIRSLGCCPTEAEVQEIIVNVEDHEQPGIVNLGVFLEYMVGVISEYKLQAASAEELLKAFQTLDKDNKGFLTTEYMSAAMTEVGEPFSQDELEEMFAVAVDAETGRINYEYYINQLMVPQPNVYDLVVEEEVVEERKLGGGLLEDDLDLDDLLN